MAQLNDVSTLECESVVRGRPELAGHNLCLNLQRPVDRLGAAGGEQVGPQQRDVRIFPSVSRVVGATHTLLPSRCVQSPTVFLSSSISCGVSTVLARLANIAIS